MHESKLDRRSGIRMDEELFSSRFIYFQLVFFARKLRFGLGMRRNAYSLFCVVLSGSVLKGICSNFLWIHLSLIPEQDRSVLLSLYDMYYVCRQWYQDMPTRHRERAERNYARMHSRWIYSSCVSAASKIAQDIKLLWMYLYQTTL